MTATETERELRESRARIVAASNAARRDIERSLHDGPQQHLVAMAVKLRLSEQALESDPAAVPDMLEELRVEVQATIQHLRDLAHSIFPPLLADRGLGEALGAAASRSHESVNITVAGDGTRRYPHEVEAAVYFSCLEAIEAATGPVSVWVGERDGSLMLEVWGQLAEGPELTNIGDRTATIGGTLAIDPEGDGVHLCCTIPVT